MRRGALLVSAACALLDLAARALPERLRREAGADLRFTQRQLLADVLGERGALALLCRCAGEVGDVLAIGMRLRLQAALELAWPKPRVVAALTAACVAALFASRAIVRSAAGDADAREEIVFAATDAAGAFSIQVRHGRVVAATLDGVPLPARYIHQSGESIRLLALDGSITRDVRMPARGLITWDVPERRRTP